MSAMRGNRIAVAAAAVGAVAAFLATNAPEALGLLVMIACLPVMSIAVSRMQVGRTRLAFSLGRTCVAGEKHPLVIELSRPTLFKSRVELVFIVENLLLGTSWELPVSLSPATAGTERYRLLLHADCPGTVRVSLKSARAVDVLGFCELPMPGASFKATYTAYPALGDLHLELHLEDEAGESGARFDLNREGTDRSEVFEIRDFSAGDSYKDVHWKLSARTRDLVVRVASRPGDHSIALLAGIHPIDAGDAEQIQVLCAELSLLASVSLGLLRAGVAHVVACPAKHGLKSLAVDDTASFYAMADELLCTPLQEVVLPTEKEWQAYEAKMSITKTIVVTDKANDEMFAKLGGPERLSVLHVSARHATGVDTASASRLMHVAAADVPGTIKALEL